MLARPPPCPPAAPSRRPPLAPLAAPKTQMSTLDKILSIRDVSWGPFRPPYGRHRRRLWGPGETVGIAVSPAATGLRPLSRGRLLHPGRPSAASGVRPSGPPKAFFLNRHFTPTFRPPIDKIVSIARGGDSRLWGAGDQAGGGPTDGDGRRGVGLIETPRRGVAPRRAEVPCLRHSERR